MAVFEKRRFKAGEWFRYGAVYGAISTLLTAIVLIAGLSIIDLDMGIAVGVELGGLIALVGTGLIAVSIIASGIAFILFRYLYQMLNFRMTGFAKYLIIALMGTLVTFIASFFIASEEFVFTSGVLILEVVSAAIVTWFTFKAFKFLKWRLPQ